MNAQRHVCVWTATEDERFQTCTDPGCDMWRWDPAYSDRVAREAARKVSEPARGTVVGGLRPLVARRFVDGKWGPQTGAGEDVA